MRIVECGNCKRRWIVVEPPYKVVCDCLEYCQLCGWKLEKYINPENFYVLYWCVNPSCPNYHKTSLSRLRKPPVEASKKVEYSPPVSPKP